MSTVTVNAVTKQTNSGEVHARCLVCDWKGGGRGSRETLALVFEDALQHAADKGHAVQLDQQSKTVIEAAKKETATLPDYREFARERRARAATVYALVFCAGALVQYLVLKLLWS